MEKTVKVLPVTAETFGNRLLKALANASLLQTDLAQRIGRTQAAVSQWCSDEKVPTGSNITLIAQTLGVSRDWLESGVGPVQLVDRVAQRGEFQRESMWAFRPAPQDGGRDYGNANVWSF